MVSQTGMNWEKVLQILSEILAWVKTQEVPPAREKILQAARDALGTDASPMNLAPQELSCAEAVSNIVKRVYPSFMMTVSTIELDRFLTNSPYFKSTKIPKPGSIINSPRIGGNPGHCGIFLTTNRIASNDSKTGKFKDNYSFDSWAREMRDRRGLKIFIYEPI